MVRGLLSIFLKQKNPHSLNQELGGDVVLVAHKCLDYDAKVVILKVQKLTYVYVMYIPKKNDCINYSCLTGALAQHGRIQHPIQ